MIDIRCAQATQEGPIFVFGLAEEPDGGGWSLIFQSDETEPGTHALSTPEGATSYDAVESWSANGDVISLHLTAHAAASLALPRSLFLRLDPAYVDARDVQRALRYFAKPS